MDCMWFPGLKMSGNCTLSDMSSIKFNDYSPRQLFILSLDKTSKHILRHGYPVGDGHGLLLWVTPCLLTSSYNDNYTYTEENFPFNTSYFHLL